MSNQSNIQRPRATGEQIFLENISRNIDSTRVELQNSLNYLVNISKNDHLTTLVGKAKSDIDRAIKHLQFAINNLKDVPDMAYIRWSQLYEINPYW